MSTPRNIRSEVSGVQKFALSSRFSQDFVKNRRMKCTPSKRGAQDLFNGGENAQIHPFFTENGVVGFRLCSSNMGQVRLATVGWLAAVRGRFWVVLGHFWTVVDDLAG